MGDDRDHTDDLFSGPELRDFHWVELTLGADGIGAIVTGLPKGGTEYYEMDRFRLEWPSKE